MGKKQKLNLNDLKVQSFVTTIKDEDYKKIHGGVGPSYKTDEGYCGIGSPCCAPQILLTVEEQC